VPNHLESQEVVDAAQHEVEAKEEEVLPVLKADAVVNPGTVVVHQEKALAAHCAVVRARGLHLVAMLASLVYP
jgi:hypothetical protein